MVRRVHTDKLVIIEHLRFKKILLCGKGGGGVTTDSCKRYTLRNYCLKSPTLKLMDCIETWGHNLLY